ncbi:MAG: TetR/AcrR family transcriptional regulator [Myxococcota bacterium]
MAELPKREASRRRILESARKIFFREGFEAANLDDVAADAGVAKGTIYRYFESKAELYVAVLAQNADAFVERMQQTIDASLAPDEQVRRIGLFYFRHYCDNREYFRIFWALENRRLIGELPEALVRTVTEVWERCLKILATQIERGVAEGTFRPCDPWSMANIFWIVANGLIQTEEHPERRALLGRELEEVFEDAVALLIAGLRPASHNPVG